jgi:ribosomal protein S18 acetylase RimI-like enzyme
MIRSVRTATDADTTAVAALINGHELAVDPAASMMSLDGTADFMNGYADESPTYLLEIDQISLFAAVVNLHPDALKKRFYADVYASSDVTRLDEIIGWTIAKARAEHPDWAMWPGANVLDTQLIKGWENFGFTLLRRYFTMRMPIPSDFEPTHVTGLVIEPFDTADLDQQRDWHRIHQDSFQNHFGFQARLFDSWITKVLAENTFDPNGIFRASVDGRTVGFCQCTDEFVEERRGYISALGVAQDDVGHGYGEALLRHGIAYCASRGFDSVELGVDTANESGALRLYEKVGFRAESSWIQMSNDDWSSNPAS